MANWIVKYEDVDQGTYEPEIFLGRFPDLEGALTHIKYLLIEREYNLWIENKWREENRRFPKDYIDADDMRGMVRRQLPDLFYVDHPLQEFLEENDDIMDTIEMHIEEIRKHYSFSKERRNPFRDSVWWDADYYIVEKEE